MHPAYSVIFFTVSSGAGYGLLAALAVASLLGWLPAGLLFWLVAAMLSLGMITAGLLSSTFHLGHPERAWRALSQWQTSWLSREGVLAVATYPVALAFFGVGAFGGSESLMQALAVAVIIFCAATVSATAMIYAALKTIPQWHDRRVLPGYLAHAAMTGLLWLLALLTIWGGAVSTVAILAVAACVVAAAVKWSYWTSIDGTATGPTAETATGLGALGAVRPLDPPHTQKNYLQHEMGYRVARKHAVKLRRVAFIAGYVMPAILAATVTEAAGLPAILVAGVTVVVAMTGMLVERWLFFAEARHVVMLYYEGNAAPVPGN
jgi:DMSO reductase anchor subunit